MHKREHGQLSLDFKALGKDRHASNKARTESPVTGQHISKVDTEQAGKHSPYEAIPEAMERPEGRFGVPLQPGTDHHVRGTLKYGSE